MMEIITKNTGGRVLAREEIIDGCTVQHYKCGCNTGVKTYHLLSLNYRKDPRFVRIYNNNFSKDILLQYSAGLVDINSMRSLLEKVTNMGRFFWWRHRNLPCCLQCHFRLGDHMVQNSKSSLSRTCGRWIRFSLQFVSLF